MSNYHLVVTATLKPPTSSVIAVPSDVTAGVKLFAMFYVDVQSVSRIKEVSRSKKRKEILSIFYTD